MTGNTRHDPQGAHGQEVSAPALSLVRGNASPEELAALVAVLAAHALATGDQDAAHPPASRWVTRRRVFHSTYPHGPGGWRASALPR
jgi:Acyl-CoA carboxylase epsilon subunit